MTMSPRSAVAAVGGDRLAGEYGARLCGQDGAQKLGLMLHHQGQMADAFTG